MGPFRAPPARKGAVARGYPRRLDAGVARLGGVDVVPGRRTRATRATPLLDMVNSPDDLKSFTVNELKQLAYELRWETINAVSKTGGHLGSSPAWSS